MSSVINSQLEKLETIFSKENFSANDASEALKLIGIEISPEFLNETEIYSHYLPVAQEEKLYNKKTKFLHFFWDSLDKTPYSISANFAIPLRRILAKQLFKKCGKNFICETGVTFNFPQKISVGDDVFMNRNVFIDSKGGVEIGNSVGITENVMIFTHSHSESMHAQRSYAPVIIEDFVKVYSNSMILPGTKIEREAIIGGKSMLTSNVPPAELFAGTPAKFIRKRKLNKQHGKNLKHIWLHNGAFQDEK